MDGRSCDARSVQLSTNAIWLWIVCLLMLEFCHLKWIWWEYWHCRACGVVNHHCACGRARRVMRYW
jgi:hypothetical protein